MQLRSRSKKGAPEWAAIGFARTIQAVQAKALREQLHLSNEEINPVFQKWTVEHMDDIESFLKRHPGFAKYIKIA